MHLKLLHIEPPTEAPSRNLVVFTNSDLSEKFDKTALTSERLPMQRQQLDPIFLIQMEKFPQEYLIYYLGLLGLFALSSSY